MTSLTASLPASAARYWNDYPTVRREINRRISGDPGLLYRDYFHALVGKRTFQRALFLNQDGNVARGFVQMRVAAAAVSVDAAQQGGLPEGPFDLIVSEGALHRVAHIDRLLRAACRALAPDGFLLSYDYVGPHRYQYHTVPWTTCERVNARLPDGAQRTLTYPQMPVILRDDPLAAVHAELIAPVWARYFTTEGHRAAGGVIAYPLLTFNDVLPRLADDEAERVVGDVLLEDLAYLQSDPDSTLFAFRYGRPKHDVLRDAGRLERWAADERDREERALRNGGRYYPPTALETALYGPVSVR